METATVVIVSVIGVVGLVLVLWILRRMYLAVWRFLHPTKRCVVCGKRMQWSSIYHSHVCECGSLHDDGKRY
jgi:hypothetical protein